jgi:hypothetical protein
LTGSKEKIFIPEEGTNSFNQKKEQVNSPEELVASGQHYKQALTYLNKGTAIKRKLTY